MPHVLNMLLALLRLLCQMTHNGLITHIYYELLSRKSIGVLTSLCTSAVLCSAILLLLFTANLLMLSTIPVLGGMSCLG